MTPTSTTPGTRGSQNTDRGTKTQSTGRGAPATSNGAAAGHRRTVRLPSPLRRVSGPAGGRSGSRPATAPPRAPRPQRAPRIAPRRAAEPSGWGLLLARARLFIAALPDHPLLDRIVRGRAWIPILGILLAGIVAMQVEVLKLSASVGRSLERGTALQSRNEQLRASVASLSDDQRIERLAASMGMVMPAPEAINFLDVRRGEAVRGTLTNIHPPDATAFLASLPLIDTPAGAAAGTSIGASAAGTNIGASAAGTSIGAASTATPSGG